MTTNNFKIINMNNSLNGEKLRDNINSILDLISESLKFCYGPYGSTTMINIPSENSVMQTKDGDTILKSVRLNGELSEIIYKECLEVSKHLATTVGDSTTTSILLIGKIFKKVSELISQEKYLPREINNSFTKLSEKICTEIFSHKRELTIDDAYNIALTSSNGNEKIANRIKELLETHGLALKCEPILNTNSKDGEERNVISDSNTLPYPMKYVELANQNNGLEECVLHEPEIYFYKDNIDTGVMIRSVGKLFAENIDNRINNNKEPIPTVIIAPSYGKDFELYIESILSLINMTKNEDKPPILFIEANHDFDTLEDIKDLCGGLWIAKAISEKDNDIDLENIEWLKSRRGRCEKISSDMSHTRVKNPYAIDKDGNKVDLKEFIISKLTKEIEIEKAADKPNVIIISNREKRINRLKRKIAYLFINVVGISDFHNTMKVYEDVCISLSNAYENGVGRAGLYELNNAICDIIDNDESLDTIDIDILNVIKEAVQDLIKDLLASGKVENIDEILSQYKAQNKPYNIVTKEFDDKLLTSIKSDIEIIKAVESIVIKLALVNQVLLSIDIPENY